MTTLPSSASYFDKEGPERSWGNSIKIVSGILCPKGTKPQNLSDQGRPRSASDIHHSRGQPCPPLASAFTSENLKITHSKPPGEIVCLNPSIYFLVPSSSFFPSLLFAANLQGSDAKGVGGPTGARGRGRGDKGRTQECRTSTPTSQTLLPLNEKHGGLRRDGRVGILGA